MNQYICTKPIQNLKQRYLEQELLLGQGLKKITTQVITLCAAI